MNVKSLEVHITALLTAAVGVISLIHPGFTVPPFVQGLVTTAAGFLAVGFEVIAYIKKHTLAQNVAAVEAWLKKQETPPAPPAA